MATKSDQQHSPAVHPQDVEKEARAAREKEALEALHPKDFKLAKEGSKDYVAGQPVDEKELGEVTSETEKRIKAGNDPKSAGGTTHDKFVEQYGGEGSKT